MQARWSFLIAVIFVSGSLATNAVPLPAPSDDRDPGRAATAAPRPRPQKKVFTNEDVEALGPRVLTPATGSATGEAAPPAREQLVAPSDVLQKIEPYIQEKDPAWYRDQLGPLQAEIGRIDERIRQLRAFRATGAGATGGLAMDQPSLRLTPENEIELLSQRRREVRQRIDDLEDGARRYSIAPGLLLAASPYEAVAPSRLALKPAEVSELEILRAQAEERLREEQALFEFAKKDLDLAEREMLLFRQQFYSNPGYVSDGRGKVRLAAQADEQTAKLAEVSAAQQKLAATQQELETLNRALGPKPAEPLTPEQQHAGWQARLRPLQEELSQVEAELARMRASTEAQRMTLLAQDTTGSSTASLMRRLETRAAALRQQIDSIADEAAHAGAFPGWLR